MFGSARRFEQEAGRVSREVYRYSGAHARGHFEQGFVLYHSGLLEAELETLPVEQECLTHIRAGYEEARRRYAN